MTYPNIYPCFEEDNIVILPGQVVMIPTGIAAATSEENGFIIKERGSTGIKGMAVRAVVIDSGYRGNTVCCYHSFLHILKISNI